MNSRKTRITVVGVVLFLMLVLYIGQRWIGLMPAPHRDYPRPAASAGPQPPEQPLLPPAEPEPQSARSQHDEKE